ncbi:MAG: radical SAM protein [Erysipelotrichaceae bacterium]|nr:radical SAM protein [Erysipelotrichaceae bacterium]
MEYEGRLFRPPSESGSLIIQATIGCSHNACAFCTMYREKKFRIRSTEAITQDLKEAAGLYGHHVKRLFFADGDALILPTVDLLALMSLAQSLFPDLERIGIYGSPNALRTKSVRDLAGLKQAGLGMIYTGIESGSDAVLELMNKECSAAEMVELCRRVKSANIPISTMIILGLGGDGLSESHARDSAKVLNKIQPEFLSFMTLMVEEPAELADWIRKDTFKLLTPLDTAKEVHLMLNGLTLRDTLLRSNHASNYLDLNGHLPEDQPKILHALKALIDQEDVHETKWRSL